jgi:hypothetical protein
MSIKVISALIGAQAADAAAEHGVRLEVVKLPRAKRGWEALLDGRGDRWVAVGTRGQPTCLSCYSPTKH